MNEIDYFDDNNAPITPWGRAVYRQRLDNGVAFFGTADFGGVAVTNSWAQKNLSAGAILLGNFYMGKYWYDQDRAASILWLEKPALLKERTGLPPKLGRVAETARKYFPEYFDPDFQKRAYHNLNCPDASTLEADDEVDLIAQGLPGNVRTFKCFGPPAKGGIPMLGDEGGAYRISVTKYKHDVCEIRRGGKVLWTRAKVGK